ncbi:MAG: zinc-ribbon domain-containing protein [Cyanobacteria bacterium SZAS-4]|nr:zinc-ribbon domain-containing protein [Cyanobacteria bacterium SZAS-4]
MTAEISNIFKTILPLCPSCRAEISDDDSFCQECGSALSLPGAAEVPQPAQLKMARLHPSLAKPVVTLPLLALAIMSFVLIMFFLVGFEKSYSGFSNHYVIEQATQAYKENRYDEAATILERFAVGHKLDEQQRALLSDVYLARAEQRVGRADYVGAMSDLDKIPPQYSKYILVTGRRNELTELIKVQQAQTQAQAFAPTKGHSKQERNKTVAPAQSTVSASANSPLSSAHQAPSAISVADLSAPRASTRLESPVVRLESPTTHSAARAESRVPNSDASGVRSESTGAPSDSARAESQPTSSPAPSDLPAQKGLLKAKAAKITESDQVRYNELLAGYFSQEHKQTSGTNEPPSLKEWIDIGRPKF